MSSFDAVVEYEGTPDRDADVTVTGGTEFVTTTANVPDVGRVEEWLAAQNLTVSEAALIVNAASMAVIALSLAWEVRRA